MEDTSSEQQPQTGLDEAEIRAFLSGKNLKSVQNDSTRRSSGCFGRRMDRIGSMSSLGCNTIGKYIKRIFALYQTYLKNRLYLLSLYWSALRRLWLKKLRGRSWMPIMKRQTKNQNTARLTRVGAWTKRGIMRITSQKEPNLQLWVQAGRRFRGTDSKTCCCPSGNGPPAALEPGWIE
ncbi:hypothetical protein GOODEAATRI_016266 [Goodea atripinnis]|uniref:Uncharacterized protein n=1 Tax=Goodea atripinnis TaxID=208336 RepID=A0ABV0NB22_9TELE